MLLSSIPKEIQILGMRFSPVQLLFEPGTKSNLFGLKNNKTVGETICNVRYHFLAETIQKRYPGALQQALGTFLLERKQAGDPFYLKFLNRCGDETYSRFHIQNANWLNRKGLYCYMVGGNVIYIGQTIASFGKRINHGHKFYIPERFRIF
jgi:hypothetical protein